MLLDKVIKTMERIDELEDMLYKEEDQNKIKRIVAELKIQKNSLEAYRLLLNS